MHAFTVLCAFLLIIATVSSGCPYTNGRCEKRKFERAETWTPRLEYMHAGNPDDADHQTMLNRMMVESGINILQCEEWSLDKLLAFQEQILE